MRDCPNCSTPLANSAKLCNQCGWSHAASNTGLDIDRHRCAYTVNGERCRFGINFVRSTTGSGIGYCHGHDRCLSTLDGAVGQRIVEESIEIHNVACPDYSTEAVVKRSQEAFLNRPLPPTPPTPPGVRNVGPAEAPGRFQRIGPAAQQLRLPDADADEERAAIQGELA